MRRGIRRILIGVVVLVLGGSVLMMGPAAAASSYTNSKAHFRISVPSGWSNKSTSRDTTLSLGANAIKQLSRRGAAYTITVRWLSGSSAWSAADRTALNTGWDSFTSQYIKDFKAKHPLRFVSKRLYSLNGFTATELVLKKRLSAADTSSTQWRVLLLTDNGTSVYAVVAQWSRPRRSSTAEPFVKEFTAVVKSFRHLVQLPTLAWFRDHPSDQFLVDMDVVATGNPFKGSRSLQPHAGAHIHFGDDYLTWPRGGSAPSNYPPIYAAADGTVDSVDYSLHVGTNDRYGIALALAQDGAATWYLDYSIEPMVPEPSPGFYRTFLTVQKGEQVKKGQLIGYMYLPVAANGTHIHFHLRRTDHQGFFAPAIFAPAVVQAFHDRWGEFGIDGGQTAIPVCMGWMLTAEENPFGTGAVDCL